jgi:hypothetical protein
MRRIAAFTILSMLAMPAMALAQDASAPPPPGAPDMQPGMQPPPDGQYAPPPPDSPPPVQGGKRHRDQDSAMMQKWQQKFATANTTHDGHLTLAQAQTAGLKPVIKHFSAIDTQNRGYITFNQLMAWHLDDEAQKMERRAAALRAED